MTFFSNSKVLVTGGTGFIGSHLTEKLVEEGAKVKVTLRPASASRLPKTVQKRVEVVECDLTNPDDCIRAATGCDLIFHLGGLTRGVLYNKEHPATMLTVNVLINSNMIEAARKCGASKYLFASSACGYPLEARVPLKEQCFFDGEPEPTNGPYGWSKRIGEKQAMSYHQEYGLDTIVVRPFNVFGPRDNFNPLDSHVIPALIRKALLDRSKFVLWGNGKATRAFVYVDDTVDGFMLSMEKMRAADPINIGTNEETSILELAEIILEHTGRQDERITLDKTKPNGQPRRSASIAKAKQLIGFTPKVGLDDGLERTIEWAKRNLRVLSGQPN